MDYLRRVVLICLSGTFAYFSSLNYGFSQDDFIHLFSSKASSIGEFLNFFNPFYQFPDIFFYRPLTTQIYFYINTTLFGLNPLPFHLEALLLHLVNSVLFFAIIQKLWNSKKVAFVSAIFYTISASHFLSLFYISAFQQIGRTFFIFLSILLFFQYQESKHRKFYFLSLLTFVGALISKETSIILPLLFLPLEVLRRKNEKVLIVLKQTGKLMIPFFLISIFYIAVRLVGFHNIFSEGDYNSTFSPQDIWQNLKWYLVWTIGLPEVLSTYPSLKPSSLLQFGQDFANGRIILILSALFLFIVALCIKGLKTLKIKIVLSCFFIFLIPLSLVLFLHGHRYPQYLDVSYLGLLPLFSSLLLRGEKFKKYLGLLGIIVFVSLQFFSINLSEISHWTTHRSKIAKYYLEELAKRQKDFTANSTVIFTGTPSSTREVPLALAQKYALFVWYPHNITDVRYQLNSDGVVNDENTINVPISRY